MLYIQNYKIIEILAIFGFMFITTLIILLLLAIKDSIETYIKSKKYEYKRKHRFDKAPTAQCYCKDCIYSNYKTGKCIKQNNHSYDAWFCADAEPRKFEV